MADTQTERAYQKQPTIFQNKKRVLLGDAGKEKLPRYYKNIGLGFKTPKEVPAGGGREGRRWGVGAAGVTCVSLPPLQAIEGSYIDKKCPFTGNVSIRGRILSGRRWEGAGGAHHTPPCEDPPRILPLFPPPRGGPPSSRSRWSQRCSPPALKMEGFLCLVVFASESPWGHFIWALGVPWIRV
uniref:Small ribosomal subunit protein uS17 N-terminal domain-containing protein n=1 Tax=Naja naja TaxID=35670 RepID=A0A8C6XYP4_NAJNA